MPDNQVYSLKIETITGEGAGLARLNGKSVFVDGAIPGETVICSLLSEQKTWAKARLLDIAEESADRVKPVCVYYAQCGGCNMQHVDYQAQLKFKAAILRDSFLRHGVNPPDPEIVPCEPWEYRNKMQFRLAPETREKRMQRLPVKNVPYFALMARGGGIIPVSDCPVADPGIRKILQNAEERKKVLPGPEKDRFNVYSRNGLLLIEGGRERGKTALLGKEIALDAKFFF
jgi:23S rRNA (uracil1939-C5)-methyltransferase